MDYNRYRSHVSLSYMTPTGLGELSRQTGCIGPHMPVLDEVQDCGILSWKLDSEKGQISCQ